MLTHLNLTQCHMNQRNPVGVHICPVALDINDVTNIELVSLS